MTEEQDKMVAERLGERAGEVFPLSFAQKRLWFLEQLEPGKTAYNIPVAFRLRGALDVPALERSLGELVNRHESLRTTFHALGGQPVQVVAPAPPPPIARVDLTGLPAAGREAKSRELINRDARRPFDLERGPLFGATVLRLFADEHILMLNMHHIVSDGWSMNILMNELGTLYEAFHDGRPSPLADLPIQYVDFAHWQRQWLAGDVLAGGLDYWRAKLGGDLPVLELPAARARPAVQTLRGATRTRLVSRDLHAALNRLGRREEATPFMTLLAAFVALLHRYTGLEDIVVGTPIANRTRRETEGVVGFFVNTLVLRTGVSGDLTFRELLRRSREVALEAYAHQDLPFEKLVEALQPERDLSHTPLFQVMLVLEGSLAERLKIEGVTVENLGLHNGAAKFDLTVFAREGADGLLLLAEYNADLFDAAVIDRLLGHLQMLIEGVVSGPDRRLADLPLMAANEERRLLVDWNDTRAPYPDCCVHQLVEARVQKAPDAVAAIAGDRHLTYAELNLRANQLAVHLRSRGVGPDVMVGVCLERSLEMVIGVLGVLKSGGAYVPLDPAYPAERLAFMARDARAPVILTQRSLCGLLAGAGAPAVCLDDDWGAIAREAGDDPPDPTSGVSPDHLAYLIYTSGSTGTPKGVAMPHRPLVNLLAWQMGRSPAGAGRTLQFTSLSFDVAFQELFSTWCAGGTLVMMAEAARRDLGGLPAVLAENHIDRLFLPFVALHGLAEACAGADLVPSDLKEVITAGERLEITPAIARLFERLAGATLENQYGPSESHVVTAHRLAGPPYAWPALPPIGRPVANVKLYILDRYLRPVPAGVPGELHIGGVALARGYLGRPELTRERFIASPFPDAGPSLYRTGDLARYLEDGVIEFLGRADHQVKVRGFRVEPGEVETALAQHPRVREAVVVGHQYAPGDRRLCAYIVVTGEQGPPAVEELQEFLRRRLPDYMVPSAFVALDRLPVTPSGKVDRRALPAPEASALGSGAAFVAPHSERERTLARIWSRVLGRQNIGVNDNFFALGGHSLLATQVRSAIQQAFHVELPLRALFERPTIAALAEAVEEALLSSLSDEELERALDELEGAGDE